MTSRSGWETCGLKYAAQTHDWREQHVAANVVSNSLLTGATGHLSHSMGREKSHFLAANRCLHVPQQHQRWEGSSVAGCCGFFSVACQNWTGLSRVTPGWTKGCFTAGQRARACSACVASAPPSGGPLKLREAEAAVKALTFVVPPSLQGGCGLVKSRAEMREEGDGGRGGGEEHVSRNKKPQGCSVWFKVNVINAPIQNP